MLVAYIHLCTDVGSYKQVVAKQVGLYSVFFNLFYVAVLLRVLRHCTYTCHQCNSQNVNSTIHIHVIINSASKIIQYFQTVIRNDKISIKMCEV